jgi:hypothetical protein
MLAASTRKTRRNGVSGAAVTQQCEPRVRALRLGPVASQTCPHSFPVPSLRELRTCSCAIGKPTTAPNNCPTNPPLSELSPTLSPSLLISPVCALHTTHTDDRSCPPPSPARASVSQVTLPPFSLPSVRVSSRSLARWIRFRMVDWWAD